MTWQEIIRQLDKPLIQALVERGYYLGTKEIKLDAVYLNDLFVTDEIIYQLELFIASVQMSTSWPKEYQQKFLELLGVTGLVLAPKGFTFSINPLLDEIESHMKSAPNDFIKIYLNFLQELDHLDIKFGRIDDIDEFEVPLTFINSITSQPLKISITSSLRLKDSYLYS